MIDKTKFPELAFIQAERDYRAKKLKELRKAAEECYALASAPKKKPLWQVKKEWCQLLGYDYKVKLLRLRKDVIRQYVKDCFIFAQSSWSNPYDTEYYSADGYDDAMAEKRSYYGELAHRLHKEWKVYFFQPEVKSADSD